MARAYECRGCGIKRTDPWLGRCPGCGRYFNIRETHADLPGGRPAPVVDGEVVDLEDVEATSMERVPTTIPYLDRILGRDRATNDVGLAMKAGHVVQIYGDPGSGKSTLVAQVCHGFAKQRYDVLYVAGEEPPEQIKERFDRLGLKLNRKIKALKETDLDAILDAIDEHRPNVVVVDSINTVAVEEYESGSIAAIKIAGREIVKVTKGGDGEGIGLILVVQITKGGDFSGPKALEHLVDTSLHLQGKDKAPRLLKCRKNRFGAIAMEDSILHMTDKGLVEELPVNEGDDHHDSEPFSKLPSAPPSPKPTTKRRLTAVPRHDARPQTPPPPSALTEKSDGPPVDVARRRSAGRKVVPLVIPTPAGEPPDAPDGTRGAVILEVDCQVSECWGRKGRACTSSDGTREAGYHASRVVLAKIKAAERALTVVSNDEPEETPDVDPFSAKPFGAPPRMKTKRPKKPPDDGPEAA